MSYSDTDGDGQIAAATEILEENNYYPFGIKHGRYNGNINSTNLGQDYKLNGKEYEDALGLNLYEMDMRSYDPTIGRWSSIDPVTHHSMSTYTAFDNNPIYWADPSGADAETRGNKTTTYINSGGDKDERLTINDGINKILFVNDSQFQEVKFFYNEFSGGQFSKNNDPIIAQAYYEFYNRVNYYDGLTLSNLWHWVTKKPIVRPELQGPPSGLEKELYSWAIPEVKGVKLLSTILVRLKFLQKHHIIPRAVYKKYVKALETVMKLNGGVNLKKLPIPFHGNHPQYNKFVGKKIDELLNSGNINESSIRALQKELNSMINKAYDSGMKLNDYFRQFNN